MTNPDMEKVVDKIRKVLALSSNNPNEEEAARALQKANKLLLEHNLGMTDIETEVNLNDVVEEVVEEAGRVMNWKKILLSNLAKLNNCTALSDHAISFRGTAYKLIGKKCNIEITLSMYDYLLKTLERKMKGNPFIGNKNSYRLGFATAIGIKIKEIIANRNTTLSSSCTALVVQEKAVVNDYMKNNYPNMQSAIINNKVDSRSYLFGKNDGESTSLNSQIKGSGINAGQIR